MTNFFLLIMPLVGGYLFLSILILTKYKVIKADGYRLFFLSAFVGIALLVIAKILIKFLLLFSHADLKISFISEWLIPTKFDLESMAALVLGIVLAYFLNAILKPIFDKHEFVKTAAKDRGELLHLMIYVATEGHKPIELTMQNDKVYIGLVSIVGELFNECVIVTPYFGGYRDKETNNMVIINNYIDVLKEINEKKLSKIKIEQPDLNIVLKMSDVAAAQVFYPEVYTELKKLGKRSIT